LTVPTADPQMASASSWEQSEAPARSNASLKVLRPRLESVRKSSKSTRLPCSGRDPQSNCVGSVRIFDLTAALAVLGVEEIPQDGEQLGVKVHPTTEPVDVPERAQHRLLHEIIGPVHLIE
jgi:hypothetical protein